MNSTQTTTTTSNEQEVTLRTLATDISSLQRGSATPQPEHLTAHFAAAASDTAEAHSSHHAHLGHVIITLILLVGMGAGLYWFLAPYVRGTAPAAL